MIKKRKIAVVVDDPIAVDLISYVIEELGHDAVPLFDAGDLYEVATLNFDLIFLDERLGGGLGHLLCAELKSNPATRHIPIVLVTADDRVEQLAACNANDYLPSPLDLDDLINKIQFSLDGSLDTLVNGT